MEFLAGSRVLQISLALVFKKSQRGYSGPNGHDHLKFIPLSVFRTNEE
jgi:hypothetical protein